MNVTRPLTRALTLALALLICTPAIAQKAIDTGITLIEAGQYLQGITELDKALADPGSLKKPALARAYTYRAQAKSTYLRKAWSNLPESSAQQVRDLATTAWADLKAAKENDADQKMAAQITSITKQHLLLLLDLADAAENKAADQNTPADQKPALYKDILLYAAPAAEIDKFHYQAYAFLGVGHLGLGDSTLALKNFHLADDWFFRSAPKDGDMNVAFIYIHIAELEYALNKDRDKALAALEEGRKNLAGESLKIQNLSNRPPAEKSKLSERHLEIEKEIDKAVAVIKAGK